MYNYNEIAVKEENKQLQMSEKVVKSAVNKNRSEEGNNACQNVDISVHKGCNMMNLYIYSKVIFVTVLKSLTALIFLKL